MSAVVSIYGSHNASISLAINGEIVRVVEIERLVGIKNMGLFFYLSTDFADKVMMQVRDMFFQEFGVKEYDLCISQYAGNKQFIFPAKEYVEGFHHESHAANSFYQSPHNEALVFSFDGGGQDRDAYVFFRAYKYVRGEEPKVLETVPYDLGFPYMVFGHFLEDIKKEPLYLGNLVYSGKIMGLCGYGEAEPAWLPYFKAFYCSNPDGPEDSGSYLSKLNSMGYSCGIAFAKDIRFSDQIGKNIAATSQKAFEEVVLDIIKPHIAAYPNLPIHMTGGCGLNILLNTRLKEEFGKDVFVAPNPNDCGLSVGMLCHHLKPTNKVDITYAGPEVFDKFMLQDYAHNKGGKWMDVDSIASKIIEGKIIGIVRGNCEHGPRALGNRSILCNPAISGMKDTLNAKVKNREYFRPFAPVVRQEDVNQYFEYEGESRWMTFSPKVKPEFRQHLESITHVDGTARVQTVTEQQNPYLYYLLTVMQNKGHIPVLLNTSFNIAGKPILNSYRDAFWVLENTQMDGLLLENFYFGS